LSTFLSLPEKQGILRHIAIIAGIWPSIGRTLSPAFFEKRDQMMRQNFNDEDKRILRQFGFSIGLAIIGVIIVIALV